jgi:hypothetical protein
MEKTYSLDEAKQIVTLTRRELDMRDKYAGHSFPAIARSQYDEVVGMRDALLQFKEIFTYQLDYFDRLAKGLAGKIVEDVDITEDVPF